jgi:hypothetical protein
VQSTNDYGVYVVEPRKTTKNLSQKADDLVEIRIMHPRLQIFANISLTAGSERRPDARKKIYQWKQYVLPNLYDVT